MDMVTFSGGSQGELLDVGAGCGRENAGRRQDHLSDSKVKAIFGQCSAASPVVPNRGRLVKEAGRSGSRAGGGVCV